MPLVINALGGGHTDRHTYRRANKDGFKKPNECGLRPCSPGLKNNLYTFLRISEWWVPVHMTSFCCHYIFIAMVVDYYLMSTWFLDSELSTCSIWAWTTSFVFSFSMGIMGNDDIHFWGVNINAPVAVNFRCTNANIHKKPWVLEQKIFLSIPAPLLKFLNQVCYAHLVSWNCFGLHVGMHVCVCMSVCLCVRPRAH